MLQFHPENTDFKTLGSIKRARGLDRSSFAYQQSRASIHPHTLRVMSAAISLAHTNPFTLLLISAMFTMNFLTSNRTASILKKS